ncbi:AMP-dependent synthetase and ligase (plasmid) [Haloterrigena turkmenica DSM 5511]|uniref:AMP-dependent synthetase and ligase n=1 Tax=Haloterrigena turkmenica (strain ATCC 51198 / DSM 5511 / JCM 9101 / NCIMB 13204 / VKM B-1734 / 4k) TaxID=543526 RepID=D2RZZ0_HALTV|nr:class I adenylate-forming enzyme family protein [Haloterrigena turkmenica]ADB62687.1 AMP-dependent synthetase and ligase [Haloterrigena turkmenica DSM 5511]
MQYNFDLGISDQATFVDSTSRFTVGDLLEKRARTDSDAVAVRESDRELTYAELDARVNRLANALLNRGYEPEESTFAILSENRSEFVEVMYASAKLGCLIGAQNWRLERTELVHCVETIDPDVVFVSSQHADKIEWMEDGDETDPEYVVFDDAPDEPESTVAYERLLESGASSTPLPSRRIDPEQGYVVMYTSGTTGLPKGAVLSHRAEFARAHQVILDYDLEKGDSYPSWAPMFHMGGIDWIVTTAVLGGTYYPIDGFDGERIVEVLQTAESPLSWLILFPGMLERLLDRLESASTDPADYQDIRSVGALLDLMNAERLAHITEILDAPAQNTYGSTEVGHATSGNKVPPGVEPTGSRLDKAESPFIQVKLVDEDGSRVERGESGELVVRGPTLCSGYLDNRDANRDEFEDGWFHTGDLVTWNQDGTYSYVNRRKYLIKSGGENIYPAEIETALLEHELVDDAIVVRTPDEKWGEVPRAVVGADDPDAVSKTELLELVREELANYKLPHYIQVVEPSEFPRSTTGKIVRETVEEWPLSDEDRVRNV